MTATILPLPLVRRRDFLMRNAGRLADAQPETAESLLAHAIPVQINTTTRRGISSDREKRLRRPSSTSGGGSGAPPGECSALCRSSWRADDRP